MFLNEIMLERWSFVFKEKELDFSARFQLVEMAKIKSMGNASPATTNNITFYL